MQHVLIDQNHFPSPSLIFLLDLMGVAHDYSLNSIVRATQQKWLQPSKERWHFDANEEHRLNYIFPFLHNLECADAIYAEPNSVYDYAVVFGGYYTRIQNRFAHLVQEWERGVRFRKVVLLTGERYLDPVTEAPLFNLSAKEADAKLLCPKKSMILRPFESGSQAATTHPTSSTPSGSSEEEGLKGPKKGDFNGQMSFASASKNTETELMMFLWDKLIPEGSLKNILLTVVDTPGFKDREGIFRRPTTKDTLLKWLSFAPKPGKCLFISSQPFIGYQNSVVNSYLPAGFSAYTVGAATEKDLPLSVYLDNLARWLYQHQLYTQQTK